MSGDWWDRLESLESRDGGLADSGFTGRGALSNLKGFFAMAP